MQYTLMKGLGWFLAALLLGVLIGWLLRSIAATRQRRRMRADHTELDRLRARIANLERTIIAPAPAALVADSVELADAEADREPDIESSRPVEGVVPAEPEFTELNLVAAAAVIGKKIKLDDLTAIEGIGPAIATLCHNIGVQTWADMAATEVSLLRTMLAEAGPRFQMHAPASWPEQAGLLATGQWEAFTTLVASLGSGRSAE